jgi:hypothetical protein
MRGKNYSLFLAGVMILWILCAGCTQPSGTSTVTPAAPVTSPSPVLVESRAVPVTIEPVVTVIRYISQTKDIKDPELLFALQVPVEWNVTTRRLDDTSGSGGLIYQTDLVKNNGFFIRTWSISNSRDQAYRDEFRTWSPHPTEKTVKINGITFDRFESVLGGMIRVGYVARKTSANERGYASVLFFSADTGNPFEKEDFEKVVSSFRYFSGSDAKTLYGEEIPRYSSSGELLESKQNLPAIDNTTGLCRCKLAG